MEKEFHDDVYSSGYNALRIIGLWDYQSKNKWKTKMYLCYKYVMLLYMGTNLLLAFLQLYFSLWDFKLISLNLSTTLFAFGIMVRNGYFMFHSGRINDVRFRLYLDRLSQTGPEETFLKDEYELVYRNIRKGFVYVGVIFLGVWLTSALLSLRWGPRELPFSLWLPIDLNKDRDFFIGFLLQAVVGIYVTVEGVNGELNFFSLMLQISLQYEMLANNVKSMQSFSLSPTTTPENEVKARLKKCVRTHLKINRYVELLDMTCGGPLLLQLCLSLGLMVFNGVELLTSMSRISLKLFYQVGYTTVIVVHIFIICFLTNYMEKQKNKVSAAVYDLPWYRMSRRLQKDVFIIIMGIQMNKSLTAWKLFKLDFYMFLGMIKMVTSFLALYWQILR